MDWSKGLCASKFVPRVLLQDHTETRTVIAGKLFEKSVQADLLLKIITRGKSWVFTHDRDMKHHSCEWQTNTSPQNKSCGAQNLSEGHADSFFDSLGALYHEFATAGERVNSAFYVQVLKHLRDATQWTELKKWRNKWILHHDSSPCPTSLTGQQFQMKNQIPTIPQPPHSPELTSYGLLFLPTLMSGLKGHLLCPLNKFTIVQQQVSQPYPKWTFQCVSSYGRTTTQQVCVCVYRRVVLRR